MGKFSLILSVLVFDVACIGRYNMAIIYTKLQQNLYEI